MLLATNRLVSSLLPAQFQRLQEELNNSLLDFHNGLRATQGMLSTNLWINQGEDKHTLLVQVEMPGFEAEQVAVELKENCVRISAEPASQPEPPAAATAEAIRWVKREREQVAVKREFQVPFLIDAEKSVAEYRKGILELRLVRAKVSEVQKLEVNKTKESEL